MKLIAAFAEECHSIGIPLELVDRENAHQVAEMSVVFSQKIRNDQHFVGRRGTRLDQDQAAGWLYDATCRINAALDN
jgi:fructose-specific component phosphotransferase system IIB-like protein